MQRNIAHAIGLMIFGILAAGMGLKFSDSAFSGFERCQLRASGGRATNERESSSVLMMNCRPWRIIILSRSI